jgi:hypothetical protein
MVRLKLIVTLLFMGFLLTGSVQVSAQCLSFAKSVCKSALGTYVHDGNYNATVLSEGETAELFKTFFEGQTYRLAVCKASNMPPIRIRVTDNQKRVLFDNKDFNYEMVWDFAVTSTQQLTVELQVLESSSDSNDLISGCVAVMFGLARK